MISQSGSAEAKYKSSKKMISKTSMLRSDLCDYSDAYIAVKGDITVAIKMFVSADFDAPNNAPGIINAATATNDATFDRKLVFKNKAPIISCVSKINNTLIENAEGVAVVMPMYLTTAKIIQKI